MEARKSRANKILPVPTRTVQLVDKPGSSAPVRSTQFQNFYDADVNSPIRRLGLNLAMIFLFFRFTGLHEVAAVKLGFNTYVLYIFGVPAIVCLLFSDGLARTLRAKQTKYWLGFVVCLIASVPFSDWRGGSLALVVGYLRTDFIVIFVIVGLVITWRECWRLLGLLAISSVVAMLLGQFFKAETMGGDDRLEITSGLTMGNSNDFAAVLTLLLPFLGLVLITPRRSVALRIVALCGLLVGLYMILSTGSRGAEIALVTALLMIVFRLPPLKAIGMLLASLAVGLAMWQMLPDTISQRLATLFFTDEEAAQSEAASSGESRSYLLKKSLAFTLQRPVFGVGPGEFADHEGFEARASGFHGNWHQTHNSYTQVSSEVGIPAAFFFIAALFSTYRLLNGTLKQARARAPSLQNATIAAAIFCVLISMVAFCASAFFLSLAYRFYFPALTAIAIVICRAAQREWSVNQPNTYVAR